MAKSKARYLADVLQGDGSLVFSGDLSVPTTFTIDPLPSGAGGSVTIGGDLVSTGGLGNASLENSSITINSYNTSLGGTVTLVTDDVLEGGSPTNLYYTDARSRASISLTDTGGDGSLTYDSGTGAFTFTGPSAAETRAHFTAGTGVSITTGEIAIGQPVATTDAVTFSSVTGTGSSSFDTLTVTTTATVPYDNTISGLTATNVQSAITELNTLLGGGNIGSQATWNVYEFTTAGNDTSFDISTQGSPSPSYVPGYVKVYLNGLLLSESDYTAVDGTTVNFSPAITNAGQLVSVVVLDSFNTAELLRVTSIDASAATNTLTIDSLSNVGIGTTSPSQKLQVNGPLVSTDQIASPGSAGSYTYNATALDYSSNGARMWSWGSSSARGTFNFIQLENDGTNQQTAMTIDSSGDVAIGTTPYTHAKLTIGGTVASYSSVLQFDNNTAGGAEFFMLASDDTWSAGSNKFLMGHGTPSSSAVDVTIDADGKVGIGTSSPSEKLEVDGGIKISNSNSRLYFGAEGGTSYRALEGNTAGSLLQVGEGYIDIALQGNVGIGTTVPAVSLHVDGTNASIGVIGTPKSDWYTTAYNGLQVADSLTLWGRASDSHMSGNYYVKDVSGVANDSYINNGYAHDLWFDNNSGDLTYRNAPSGSADAQITSWSTRLVIKNDGNVGIGTDSPGALLEVNDGGAVGQIRLTRSGSTRVELSTNANEGELSLYRSSNAKNVYISSYYDSYFNGGNVGIGTTSPASPLNIKKTGTVGAVQEFLRLENNALGGTNTGSSIDFYHYTDGSALNKAASIASLNTDSWPGGIPSSYSTGLTFSTLHENTFDERMRIDSSGNLLVGTTNANPTSAGVNDAGVELSNTGGVRSTVAANPAATFNRKGSAGTENGEVALFRSNGTTVGSIGTDSGDLFVGTGNTTLRFNNTDDAIYAGGGDGSGTNAGTDLGTDTYKFGNLYLSGGAYLGGTGAANYLDDYEEGTFTATLVGATSQPSPQKTGTGYYTKIGRSVEITISFENVDTTGYAGQVTVSGVPFANNYGRAILSIGSYNLVTWTSQLIAVLQNGSSVVELLDIRSGNTWAIAEHSAGTTRYLWINGVFQTNS